MENHPSNVFVYMGDGIFSSRFLYFCLLSVIAMSSSSGRLLDFLIAGQLRLTKEVIDFAQIYNQI